MRPVVQKDDYGTGVQEMSDILDMARNLHEVGSMEDITMRDGSALPGPRPGLWARQL